MATCASCKEEMELSAGMMTADGMKCPNCVMKPTAPDPDLLRKAGPMPNTLTLLVALMAISIALDVFAANILGVVFSGALLFGILVGNDGVRKFVIGLAYLNLAQSAVRGAIAVNDGVDSTLVLFAMSLAVGVAVYIIWCLRREDVRDWMFRTAFKDGL